MREGILDAEEVLRAVKSVMDEQLQASGSRHSTPEPMPNKKRRRPRIIDSEEEADDGSLAGGSVRSTEKPLSNIGSPDSSPTARGNPGSSDEESDASSLVRCPARRRKHVVSSDGEEDGTGSVDDSMEEGFDDEGADGGDETGYEGTDEGSDEDDVQSSYNKRIYWGEDDDLDALFGVQHVGDSPFRALIDAVAAKRLGDDDEVMCLSGDNDGVPALSRQLFASFPSSTLDLTDTTSEETENALNKALYIHIVNSS